MTLMTLACQTGTRSEGFRLQTLVRDWTMPPLPGHRYNQTSLISTFSLALTAPRWFIELSRRAIQKWSPFPPLSAFTVRLTPEEMDCCSFIHPPPPPPGPDSPCTASGSRHTRERSSRTLTGRCCCGVGDGRSNGLLTIGVRLAKKWVQDRRKQIAFSQMNGIKM